MDRSERIGLGVSTSIHALFIAALALGLFHWNAPKTLAPPAFEVALTDKIALESRAASHEEVQTAQAPDLGPSEPDQAPPQPAVVAQPQAQPQPKPLPEPEPEPKPVPPKQALAKAVQPPAPTKTPSKADAKPAPATAQSQRARASVLGDLMKGLDAPTKSNSTNTAASGNAPLSADAARALKAEITRQLKPYWRAPTGVDADKLITTLRWRLNPDGTLASGPDLISQTGKTASNMPQQQLHAEAAIRAIRAAAPFRLPPDFYDNWKLIEFGFDKRL
jgi:hypothetical protein